MKVRDIEILVCSAGINILNRSATVHNKCSTRCKQFMFSKLWLMFAKFKIQWLDSPAA